MRHDKMITRRRIIEAVRSILFGKQSSQIGVNAVAKEAGIDKVMIYRYFGSMDKLLIAFAGGSRDLASAKPTPQKEVKIAQESFLGDIVAEYLTNFLDELRRDHVAQEILRWNFVEKNALTNFVNDEREKQGKSLMSQIPFDQNKYPGIDLTAIIALLHAGINPFSLMRHK